MQWLLPIKLGCTWKEACRIL